MYRIVLSTTKTDKNWSISIFTSKYQYQKIYIYPFNVKQILNKLLFESLNEKKINIFIDKYSILNSMIFDKNQMIRVKWLTLKKKNNKNWIITLFLSLKSNFIIFYWQIYQVTSEKRFPTPLIN